MTAHALPEPPQISSRAMAVSALVALVVEAVALVWVGSSQHWLAHPQRNQSLDTERFIEAEMVQVPPEPAHLTEEKPLPKAPPKPEVALSRRPDIGRRARPEEQKQALEEKNQTAGTAQYPPSHGPVVLFSPSPAIPSYLQNQDLQTSVVIDFYISTQGGVTPRLVGSSGNDELDAIALGTARKWQFRPAEKDHHPVDSKVRLRIIFEVH